MMRPRIALVAASLDILGGQGVRAHVLVERLRSEGYEVAFVPIHPRFPRRLKWLRRHPYVRTFINQALCLPSLLQLQRADVVHIFSASYWSFLFAPLPVILAAKCMGKRVVLNYHGGEAEDQLARWGKLVRPWLWFVNEIVVPSEYLKSIFVRHGYKAREIRDVTDASRAQEKRALHPELRAPVAAGQPLQEVDQYTWPTARDQWLAAYSGKTP